MITIIELFDKSRIKNIVTSLYVCAKKIIFIGYGKNMTENAIFDTKQFFRLKKVDVELEFITVDGLKFDEMVKSIEKICFNATNPCFDITGGSELILAAIGAVAASNNIPILEYDIKHQSLIKHKNNPCFHKTGNLSINIKENMALYGASISEKNFFNYDFNFEFKKDIEKIWSICAFSSSRWNKHTSSFARLESYTISDNPLEIYVNSKELPIIASDDFFDFDIINLLKNEKLIKDFVYDKKVVKFSYKNLQVKNAILKSGNILELYSFICMLEINSKTPGFYDDIDMGVTLDWDVVANNNIYEIDTKNEVDLVAMRNQTPIFISCKNGEVQKEALYELDVIAKRFGGEFSKKILITTHISQNDRSKEYIKERAKDMNITIISNICKLTKNEFIEKLITATKNI